MAVKNQVTGNAALDRKLARMPKRLQKKMQKKATKVAAKEIILPDAKAMAPIDEGKLEKSIVVRSIKRTRTQVGNSVQTRDGYFKGETYYGGFQEFGWDDKPEGDPFLRPALYANESKVRRLFKSALRLFIAAERVTK